MFFWLIGFVALVALALGANHLVGLYRAEIRDWWADAATKKGVFGTLAVLGGLTLLVMASLNRPGLMISVGAIVALAVIVYMNWGRVWPWIQSHWWQVVGAIALVAGFLWLREVTTWAAMSWWLVTAAVVAILVVFWSAIQNFIIAHWKMVLGVTAAVILLIALVGGMRPAAQWVSGVWREATSTAPLVAAPAVMPEARTEPAKPATTDAAGKPVFQSLEDCEDYYRAQFKSPTFAGRCSADKIVGR